MIGRVISGRYVVEAVVGMGGMAVVYRAYDKIKKQTVAVKVLRPEYESDEEFVRRFSREAEAASKVSHENIVNMLDVGIDGEKRYIVMEYVDGQTLKEMIRQKGRIEPDVALRMTIRILAAVDHAHRNGIVHRDIKPQNILVDKQGRVKVADFGIARLKASQTTRIDTEGGASALGSVHYFSPEQARGEVADEKSDLYSVGVVMYEMLTGQVPFDGETSVSVALKHVSEEPKSMRIYQNGISKALDEVVMRALCKDKTRRYQSAAEMAADLRKTITHPRGGFVKYPMDPDEVERQRETRRKKHLRDRRRLIQMSVIVGLLIVLSMMLIVGWYLIMVRDKVTVPSVIGQSVQNAQEQLEKMGLPVGIESVFSEDYETGCVVYQSKEAGDRVRRGSGITLTVSAGTKWFFMEDCIGMDESAARELLKESGAIYVTTTYVHSEKPVGEVLSQSLSAGWQSKEDTVLLTVSGASVRMPSLTGLTLDGAQALIESEGLKLGTITEGYSADAPTQTVIAQSIAPNSETLVGSAVDLTISQAPTRQYMPDSEFTVVVPLENLEVEVMLTAPSGNEVTVYSGRLSVGTYPIELSSEEQGIHRVRVYMDGVLMDSTEIAFE